jgi:hypothetical protein
VELAKRLDERILHCILCLATGDPVRDAQSAGAVLLDQIAERVDIARPGAFDELRVTGLIHVLSLLTPLVAAWFRRHRTRSGTMIRE